MSYCPNLTEILSQSWCEWTAGASCKALPASIQRMRRDMVLGRSRSIFLSPFHSCSLLHVFQSSHLLQGRLSVHCWTVSPWDTVRLQQPVLAAAGHKKHLLKLEGTWLLMFLRRKNCQVLTGSERKWTEVFLNEKMFGCRQPLKTIHKHLNSM